MTTSSSGERRWVIRPYEGVGPLALGLSRAEVESALGTTGVSIDKGDPLPTAVFGELGVHVHFAADDRCEAVELMSPAQPELAGHALLGEPYPQLRDWLDEQDPELVLDSTGATSELLGVGLYAPLSAERPASPAEGVIVFVRDYYRD